MQQPENKPKARTEERVNMKVNPRIYKRFLGIKKKIITDLQTSVTNDFIIKSLIDVYEKNQQVA